MNPIPITWATTTLGKVIELTTGKLDANAATEDGEFPFFTCGREVLRIDNHAFDQEAVLLAGNGDFGVKHYVGKFNAYQRTYVMRPLAIDGRFLFFLVQYNIPQITANERGSTVRYLRKGDIEDAAVSIPPLREQSRIVGKIDSLKGKAKRARDQLDHIPRLVEKFKQAVLQSGLEGTLTGIRIERSQPFGELITSTFYGPRFSKAAYMAEGIPTIRTTDFSEDGRITLDGTPRVAVSKSDLEKWCLQHEDILVTRTGSIGKCAVYHQELGPALPSTYLIRVRVDNARLLPKFAFWCLSSPVGQEHLGVNTTAVTQPNINANAIRSLPIPICSIEQQRIIVRRIERAFAWIDRLAAEATSARSLIDRLDQAVLAKAFRGELVPQDPSDEPASVLLNHVAKTASGGAGRMRRGRRSAHVS